MDDVIGSRDKGWRKINHRHDDGRNCIEGPDGVWRHWDFEGKMLAPGEPTPELECGREHPSREERVWDGPQPFSDGDYGEPDNARSTTEIRHVDCLACRKAYEEGRGEFGMPTIGGELRVGPDVIFQMPDKSEPDPGDGKIDMPDFKMTVTEDGISVDYGDNGYATNAQTDDARYILAKVLPGLLSKFLNKNSKYALAQSGHDLGLKGIVPDINRKTSVLINRLWHGGGMVGEGTEEVIDDLIGHLLLMRAKLRTLDE